MTEDMAWLRIRVARTAAQPRHLPALADGQLNPTSVLLLAPKLLRRTRGAVAAAAGSRKTSSMLLLAERFPRPDLRQGSTLPADGELEVAPTSNWVWTQ